MSTHFRTFCFTLFVFNFYITFQDNKEVPPLVAEISWTKIYLILEKCKNSQEREFYFKMTRKYGWTKEVLVHNISIKSYEKFLLNQTNFVSFYILLKNSYRKNIESKQN